MDVPQFSLFVIFPAEHLGGFQFLTVLNKVIICIHAHTGFYLNINFHFTWVDSWSRFAKWCSKWVLT